MTELSGAVVPPRPRGPSLPAGEEGSAIKTRRGIDAKVHWKTAGFGPRLCRVPVALNNDGMTLGNGYLGSRIDEERSEMRYVV